jgi:hypothetical protein
MYRVEPIGHQFTGKGHQELADRLTAFENEGWELVQVFPVVVSGCIGQKQQTNYAVLRKSAGSQAVPSASEPRPSS